MKKLKKAYKIEIKPTEEQITKIHKTKTWAKKAFKEIWKFKVKKWREKGEAARRNIQKQVIKVQKLYQKPTNMRTDR